MKMQGVSPSVCLNTGYVIKSGGLVLPVVTEALMLIEQIHVVLRSPGGAAIER